MNKIDDLSFLKELRGKAGRYSDSRIAVDCQTFRKKEEGNHILTAEIRIIPKHDKKETAQTLKNLFEKNKVWEDIEKLVIDKIEKAIAGEISNLQEELRELLGLSGEQDPENKSKEYIYDADIGGTHEVNN